MKGHNGAPAPILEEYKRSLFLGRAFQPAPLPTLAFRFEQTERLFFASLTMHVLPCSRWADAREARSRLRDLS